jgi:hypothetical protein
LKNKDLKRHTKSKNLINHLALYIVLAVPKISVLTILPLKNVDLHPPNHSNCPLQSLLRPKGH